MLLTNVARTIVLLAFLGLLWLIAQQLGTTVLESGRAIAARLS